MRRVTVAPITTTVKGLSTEVSVGPANGLEQACVVSCDNIITIDKAALGRHIGFLFESQEPDLTGRSSTRSPCVPTTLLTRQRRERGSSPGPQGLPPTDIST